jgi:hypothetical protein
MLKLTSTHVALLGGASLAALAVAQPAAAQTAAAEAYAARLATAGDYLSGDKHNHTTCTDGSTSVRTLVDQSTLVYDLDWFAQTGHGGSGNRDCRFDDVQSGNVQNGRELARGNSRQLWVNTVGRDGLKGDPAGGGNNMWRWQSLAEYAYPDVANAGRISGQATWLGIEGNVPGHEHVSMGILGNQFRTRGDAYATAQFEYLWDRSDNDFSGGEEYDFENPRNNGVPKQRNVAGDHQKSVASVAWLRRNHPRDSYYIPAHIERQGAYVPNSNLGFNVEDVRDYHNAGLFNPSDIKGQSVSFGAEFAPGHQLQTDRGSYSLTRPTAGLGTYGGQGAYAAAEISLPGKDFDGNDLDAAKLAEIRQFWIDEVGGNPFTGALNTSRPIARYVLGRPGVRSMWDALLGEGRRYFNFWSSDWHNRGAFGPFEPYSTNDAWPGEYQKIWAYARGGDQGYSYQTAKGVVDGMRTGNSWSVKGDLIDELSFIICQGSRCATMGETLKVNPSGEAVVWYVRLRDPAGKNNSPYAFDNPSLLQVGLNVPVNEPVLDNIDIIRGDVTGPIAPSDAAYRTNVSNPTTEIFATVFNPTRAAAGAATFAVDGERMVASGEIPAASIRNDMYFRMRGTNMPKGTPNETDADGNPLIDYYANNIPCPFPYTDPNPATTVLEFNAQACPFYLPVNERLSPPSQVIDFDVEAWSDLWFMANPIFIEVEQQQAEAAPARRG